MERVWKGSQFPAILSAKVKLFYTTCKTSFLYGCESWVLSLLMESKINAFAISCYKIMLGIKRQDCISNIAIYHVYSMTNTETLVYYVRKCQLDFLGHILRLQEEEPARRFVNIFFLNYKTKQKTKQNKYVKLLQGKPPELL